YPTYITNHPLLHVLAGITFKKDDSFNLNKEDYKEIERKVLTLDQLSEEEINDLCQINKVLKSKKNILIIVIESLGSKELFIDQKIKKEIFPSLSARKDLISFSELHSTFPGTTRSHIAIQTGGIIPTYSSIQSTLKYPYTGPSLVLD